MPETKIPVTERQDCVACGTWVCDGCGHRRNQVNRSLTYTCPRCSETRGHWLPVRHQLLRMVESHAEWAKLQTKWRETGVWGDE